MERNVPTTNSDGQKLESWASLFSVCGKITARGAMERRVFEQMRAECDYLVEIRWTKKALTIKAADCRLRVDGKTLNIGGVYDPDGNRRVLQLHCTEVVI